MVGPTLTLTDSSRACESALRHQSLFSEPDAPSSYSPVLTTESSLIMKAHRDSLMDFLARPL